MVRYRRFMLARTASASLTLLGVSIVIFIAIHLLPGDFADVFLGQQATPQAKARITERFGLDRPLPEQYGRWLGSALMGDFGDSLVTQRPVIEEFAKRVPVTGQLASMAIFFSLFFGVPLGIVGGLTDTRRYVRGISRITGSFSMSVPDFVLGTLLVYLFSRYSLGLTVGGWAPFFDDPITNLRAMVLPALALSGLGIGFVLTTSRHATVTVFMSPYVMAAAARGASFGQIVRRHVLRNAAIPVVTVLAIYFGYLLGGTVIVESLFSIPGLGRYVIEAVRIRDYPVIQAGVLLAASFFVALNMMADLAYAALDPRIGSRRESA